MEGVTIARVFKTACELLRGRYCSRHTVIRPTFVPRFHKRNQTFRVVENVRSWANKRMIDNEPATRIVFRSEHVVAPLGCIRTIEKLRVSIRLVARSVTCLFLGSPCRCLTLFLIFLLFCSTKRPTFSRQLSVRMQPAGNGISGVTLCRLKSDKKERERWRVDESEREKEGPEGL